MLLFMAAVVSRVELREILHVAMLAVGAHVVIAIVLLVVAPDRAIKTNWAGTEGRLGGLLGAYTMAHAAALFLLSGMIIWRERWLSTGAFALIGGVSALALLLTQTRSAMVAAALGLMSVGRFRPASVTAVAAVFLTGIVAVNAIPGALEAIALQASRSDNAQGTLSLTGRIYIWRESLRLFAERPLLGYGFAATKTLFPQEFVKRNPEGETPPHAHNIIVQSLVTTGVVGTLILLIPLSIPVIHSLRHRDGMANPLTWYTTIIGLAVLGPVGARPGIITLFWMLSLLMIQLPRPPGVKDTLVERRTLGHARPLQMDTSHSSQIR
jgi:O-antigen ligase